MRQDWTANGRLVRRLNGRLCWQDGDPRGSFWLDRITDYRTVLESYSQRLLPLVRCEVTEKFNVRIVNDTGDFYRFFDATPHAEFLYECVQRTIEEDLPNETAFLETYDTFRRRVEAMIDMPERIVDLLFRFLQQNEGRLSNRARSKEFKSKP